MPKLGGARGGIAYSDCRRVGALAVDCRGTCLTRPKGRAFRLVVPHCNTAKQTSWKHLYCGAISPCAMSPMTVWFITNHENRFKPYANPCFPANKRT